MINGIDRKYVSVLCPLMFGILAVLAASGCSATHQARSVKTSGFLGDYTQLHEGKGDEALLTYVSSSTNFNRYTKIMMDPIKVYPGVGDSLFGSMPDEDLQKLLNYLDATLRKSLGTDYVFVKSPGPDVMRMRIALTESDGSQTVRDVASSIVPIGMAISALKSVAVGRASGVGAACVEFELLDSQSGQRLAASVDRRIGNKYTGKFDKFNRWRATQAAFDYWAERLQKRLNELKGKAGA